MPFFASVLATIVVSFQMYQVTYPFASHVVINIIAFCCGRPEYTVTVPKELPTIENAHIAVKNCRKTCRLTADQIIIMARTYIVPDTKSDRTISAQKRNERRGICGRHRLKYPYVYFS
jgi:hypothetical protein